MTSTTTTSRQPDPGPDPDRDPATASAAAPPGRARVALFGAGPWAAATQAPAIAGHDGVDFAGVWARRPEAARALADAHGTTAYSGEDGIGELLAACDAAAFALPPDVQAPLAARAARAGRHVLLDKPVATDVAAARAAADAVARAGVASVVFCTLRFARETRLWIDRQIATGGWFTARAQWLGALYAPGGTSPYAASPWRRERGGLWDLGPHMLSVLIPVLGEVTAVTAAPGPEGTAHLVLRHASGASSTATLGLSAPPKAASVIVECLGDSGTTVMPEWSDPVAAFRDALDALLESARTGRPHPCDIHFGTRLTELLATAEGQMAEISEPSASSAGV
ncbi:Gfo/Idh/MocA family oxidoreductase [Streptomyces sp. NPDC020875]|uniref:Gfo/Idh/MocA family oxidoreductase n=1 Tax=Streptomyces sp. NPDC020875 TaxID=3154898 RepID=UPI0033D7B7F9